MTTTKSNPATEAAHKMMQDHGYIVLAFHADAVRFPGDIEHKFSGQRVLDARLRLTEPTNKKDWDTQLHAIFGNAKTNQRFASISTAQFWRAVLEPKNRKLMQFQYWIEGDKIHGRLRQHHQVFGSAATMDALIQKIAKGYAVVHSHKKTLDLITLTMRQLKRRPR